MAHVWILNDSREWTPQPLVGDAAVLAVGAFRRADDTPPLVEAEARVLLRRLADPPTATMKNITLSLEGTDPRRSPCRCSVKTTSTFGR